MQYLNTILWETFPKDFNRNTPAIPEGIPKVAVVSEKWKRDTCSKLGLTFQSSIRQPSNIGQPISDYEPWQTEDIDGDGNCLFRCLSKILTGSQESHIQVRRIVASFIASEGTTRLGWYFRQKGVTPCNYFLDENFVYLPGTWGGDVEIMAASAILNADIYVANNDYRKPGSFIREVRWSLLRASLNPTATLYITNYGDHYEPVISMLNSPTPTFGMKSDDVLNVE